MSLNTKHEKHILVWCANGMAMLDMWLPVIRKLKEKEDVKIDFLLPEPSTLGLEDKYSGLINLSEKFVDNIIYRGYSDRWFVASTLIEARTTINATKFNKFDAEIFRLSFRLTDGKASKYAALRIIGKYLLIVYKYFIRTKENFVRNTLYDFSLLEDADGMLFDVTVEGKGVHPETGNELKNIQRFSMRHGLGATWLSRTLHCKQSVAKRLNVTVYSISHLETNGYEKCHGILEKNIVHAGIPRHDKDWIEFVCNESNDVKVGIFDSFVFLIGMPISSCYTPARKKKALKNIYNVICVKHKLKLVVKTHPKESLDGINGSIYRDALGMENYEKTWMFSSAHPFLLGKKSLFSISFHSGVPIDMLAINKPTIEYIDRGLEGCDNKESFRGENGKPVSEFTYLELVLGARSKLELEQHVECILNQYEATVLPLRSRYDNFFKTFDGASEMVANNIYKKIQ